VVGRPAGRLRARLLRDPRGTRNLLPLLTTNESRRCGHPLVRNSG
jgi:hypothetical protein